MSVPSHTEIFRTHPLGNIYHTFTTTTEAVRYRTQMHTPQQDKKTLHLKEKTYNQQHNITRTQTPQQGDTSKQGIAWWQEGDRKTTQHNKMTWRQHQVTRRQHQVTRRQHHDKKTTPDDKKTTPWQEDNTMTRRQHKMTRRQHHDKKTTPWREDNTRWQDDNTRWQDDNTRWQEDNTRWQVDNIAQQSVLILALFILLRMYAYKSHVIYILSTSKQL